MLLVMNPAAGQGKFTSGLFDVVDRFTRAGFEVTVYPTTGPRHAHRIALERATDFDYLVCAGGDGTLNEVVSALMLLPRRPLLGHLPAGSANDFAITHGMPTDYAKSVQAVIDGSAIAVDVGSFQDKHFTYVAAFGLLTDVSYGTPQALKNTLGHAAYLLEGVKKLANIKHWYCRVELEDEVIEDEFIFGMISNSRSVGRFNLPDEVDICLDDGAFELFLLRRITRYKELKNVVSVLMGGKGKLESSFVVRSVKKARIVCDEALSWTLDGEFGGSFNVTDIAVRHRAVEIVVPPPKKDKRGA